MPRFLTKPGQMRPERVLPAIARRLAERALIGLRAERGMTLVLTLGVLTALSATVIVVIQYGSASGREAGMFKTDKQAFALAEAGMNNAIAVLNNPSNNALDPDILPARTTTYEGGRVDWSGVLDRTAAVWTLTATGYSRNPTGPNGSSEIKRTLNAKVTVVPTLTQPLNNPSWNYLFSKSTALSPCDMTLSNNLGGSSRLYVAGDLCLSQNAGVNSSELIVHGNLILEQNAFIGANTSMDTRVQTSVGGYCSYAKYNGGAQASPCSGNQDVRNIFSKTNPSSWAIGVSSSPPIIGAPVSDFSTWYENSIPGPSQSCTTASGTPPTFDNDYPARNNSLASVFDLTPATSYTCRVGTAETPSGEISWNASTKVLTVAGTIYIDGSLKSTNTLATYNGQAVIYLTGTFWNNGKLCASVSGSNCEFSTWNPNTEMLTITTEGSGGQAGVGNGILMDNNSQFQGALYSTANISFTNNSRSDGPMVANQLLFANNVQNDSFPTITVVPVGQPGNPAVYAQPNPPQNFSG
jgi:Tfp pilus assembly protein PilX